MKRIFETFLIGTLLLWVHGSALAADETIRIVVFGDSLTAGYQLQPEQAFPAKLDRKLREIGFSNIEVINMSMVDETSTGAVDRLPDVIKLKPDIVIVELGVNDTAKGIGIDLIYRNIGHIVNRLKEKNIYTILMGVRAPEGMGSEYSRRFDTGLYSLARYYNISFYPDALAGISGKQEMTLADELHPSAKGVDVMVEGMYRMVDAAVRWKWEAKRYEQQFKQDPSPIR